MSYLIVQTFILLLLAAALGLVLGWYLTRLANRAAQASLQARLQRAEADVHELRGELDAAVTARSNREVECRALADELAALKAKPTVDSSRPAPPSVAAPAVPPAAAGAALGGVAPTVMAAASSRADDLQQIRGIGPKIAAVLTELGIVRLEQIAAWTPQNVEWVNAHLRFKGRIEREQWIPQARALLAARDADD